MPAPSPTLPALSLLALALAPAIALAAAQSDPQQTQPSRDTPPAGSSHGNDTRHQAPTDLGAVVVTASPLQQTAENLSRPVEVLSGERLDAAKRSSLGETVGKLPGVQSSYFGPGVGRPVIRGFEGARVQVLSDGLGSGDVSTVSSDHAVSIEPFLADQIEVLKGPATLLYGSGAIGGAVNVVDGRVPESAPAQPFSGRAELRADSGNDGRTAMGRMDGATSNGWVFHFDALHRETDDYDIPGYPESRRLMAAEGETPDPAERGTLPNSAVRTDSGAVGVSWIGERGFIGAGVSLFNTRYGVPGHSHAEGHDHEGEDDHEHAEEGPVRILMDQHRGELRAGLNDLGPFKTLRFKLAHTEYTHTEFEGDEVGTVFDNDSIEGRLELVHQPVAGFDGAFGLQWGRRNFEAIGAEAFVPASRSNDAGLFWIGNRDFGSTQLELGARHDRNRIKVNQAQAIGADRDFNTTSLSTALKWDMSEQLHLSLGLDRAQRAPTAEELYSNGVHVATASVELGNPRMDVETANRAEIGLHWHSGPLKILASLYHVRFDDYIYQADTGVQDHGTDVRLWTQGDARFNGAEAELNWNFIDNDSGRWNLRVFGDAVRGKLTGSGSREVAFRVGDDDHFHDYTATLAGGGNLPRMAPWRAGAELGWESDAWRASLGAVRYARQDRVARNESETPGYTLVDANIAWHRDTAAGNAWEVFVDGRNLLDKEARVHTSFLKDLAPLPGRSIGAGVRLFF